VPEGMDIDENFDCLDLLKEIYGLKQASRVWNETFDSCACSIGFKVSKYDPCLYMVRVGGKCVFTVIDVDDFIITGNCVK
jgi:hypothetical protein